MKSYVPLLILLAVVSSQAAGDSLQIEKFHDQNHALVTGPDGSLVPVAELDFQPPFTITGMESGQYLFKGPNDEEYRVYVPEVVTSASEEYVIVCDHSPIVMADDYGSASARGVDGECER
ncbi:MAG: hypothetical protein ABJM11_15930 [Marinobacter sp.]|uniref:hypothetical protein n=1 Tax=Marinobacter sp. TaxID=50741 RepID=UPI0032982450